MRGICAVMLCVLLWCCSGEDNPSSSEESLRHKHDISGAFLFDYEWPVFFVESCVYIDGQMLPKCGLFAYGVGFGDGGIYYDNTDFSKTKIHTKKDSLHSILSYVLIRSRSPYSEYFSSESHRPITAVSPFWGIYLNEDTSFFEKENLEVKKYDNYRRLDGSLFCMQKNSPMLIEADDDGVVEFELTDAAGKTPRCLNRDKRIIAEDFHAEVDGCICNHNTDSAETDDAELFSVDLVAGELLLLLLDFFRQVFCAFYSKKASRIRSIHSFFF